MHGLPNAARANTPFGMDLIVPNAAMLATFMAILLGAFLLLVPSAIRLANSLLALFLFTTAIDVSGWFISDWWAAHPKISSLRPVVVMLQMPFYTGFIWFSCFQRRSLHARDAWHFVPAGLVLAFIITGADIPYLSAAFEAQYAIYIAAAVYALWRVRLEMRTRFVGQSASWRWLVLLVVSSLVAHSLFVIRTAFAVSLTVDIQTTLQTIAALLVLAITVAIAFQALLSPQIFRGADRLLVSAANEIDASDEGNRRGDTKRLVALMDQQHPYLDPDMSLSRLARLCGITAKDLSALINQRHGLHFFDFLNRYRIEHAQRLLKDSNQSVTEILYASGFNAKSSFNTAFKKHVGMTPSAYRKESRTK
ncbi:helix-turn-helix domain-containing protein [Pontixanthobacter gangjinensis]|uniref:Helix-turn-helix domain-containing protein n=1 Tax=Pontixanthobacter gangjinensis TaxID=1028742 RepID=A0A6I4SJI5_9SPHN|nr:helix-turn-helix domain-containing protein [Pontixanthobacter gangjinensis]MXO55270.1 helix-turn-helix domain-containing protein [Pontixanthobacter gangjinensis]